MSEIGAEILPTHSPILFQTAVERAAERLRAGDVVALPTETVYGLAANALDAAAVQRIYEIKGRPAINPIIVHVAGPDLARRCVTEWPPLAAALSQAFWPGPLTLVLPKSAEIPAVVTAGGPTVGIRWPAHPFIQAVIQACGFPLAAPSANLANRLSPTRADHVREQLGARLRLIVDGGPAQVGLESTVLDLTASPPRLLRPGMIHEEALLAVTGGLTLGFGDSEEVIKSPGLLRKHYAPRAPLLVLSWRSDGELLDLLARRGLEAQHTQVVAHTQIPARTGFAGVSVIPHDAEAFARALYAELHRCDQSGVRAIVVESVPDRPEWRAIADRLARASAPPES